MQISIHQFIRNINIIECLPLWRRYDIPYCNNLHKKNELASEILTYSWKLYSKLLQQL